MEGEGRRKEGETEGEGGEKEGGTEKTGGVKEREVVLDPRGRRGSEVSTVAGDQIPPRRRSGSTEALLVVQVAGDQGTIVVKRPGTRSTKGVETERDPNPSPRLPVNISPPSPEIR